MLGFTEISYHLTMFYFLWRFFTLIMAERTVPNLKTPAKIGIMSTVTVILFGGEMYGGQKQELEESSPDLPDLTNTFPEGVRSIIFEENAKKWQVFTKVGYHGANVILQPGRRYPRLDDMGLENPANSMRRFSFVKSAAVYQDEGYGGKREELEESSPDLPDLTNTFTEGARSIILKENAKKWQVFTQVGYHGATVALEPGRQYTSLDAMGLENPVMSMKKSSVDNADVNTKASTD